MHLQYLFIHVNINTPGDFFYYKHRQVDMRRCSEYRPFCIKMEQFWQNINIIKKRLLLRQIYTILKSDSIKNMDHMRISRIEL